MDGMEKPALDNTKTRQYPKSYRAWLQYRRITDDNTYRKYRAWLSSIGLFTDSVITNSAVEELAYAVESMLDVTPFISHSPQKASIILGTYQDIPLENYGLSKSSFEELNNEGYLMRMVSGANNSQQLLLAGKSDKGVLYAVFTFLRLLQMNTSMDTLDRKDAPAHLFRMINQWDNIDGTVERGYSGHSIFYIDNDFKEDIGRMKDYARLLSSAGINAISINNVNVWDTETNLITAEYLPKVKKVSDIFNAYGISLFLSINYASPMSLGKLDTADPLDNKVKKWWKEKAAELYHYIPSFGGFVVKADSEGRPGPFTYDRNHADGANVLAEALKPYHGIVIWRCFVYNHKQDWRDRHTDRARAAYDHFKPMDGRFLDNVILQIKNGPMDFQVREPVSPLIGALEKTNYMLELQIAQEYTGQQIDVCYLIPQWKEYLDFDTHAGGKNTKVKDITNGSVYKNPLNGIAAVSNIGDNLNWTGHTLAQANLYGYGKLIWDPEISTEDITREWIVLTFGDHPKVVENIEYILLHSWEAYERYTSPLGIGWMINPGHHYGPNIDGYEYSKWGTYHFADREGMGVDRTVETGTGYTSQYFPPNAEKYNSLETCPDELLLFFHHVPYTHTLHSGKTVIQHLYDTHFQGVEMVENFIEKWEELEGHIDEWTFENVKERFQCQLDNAIEWRDQVNTYFYRKSGIEDKHGRTIY